MTNADRVKRDSTYRIKTTWRDFANALVDPASHSLQFYEPSGVVSGAAITSPFTTGTGIFYYDYDTEETATLGLWKWLWKTKIGGLDEVQDGEFQIIPRVID
jgi:hypothetical protein